MQTNLKQLLNMLLKTFPEDNRHSLQKAIDGPLWKDDNTGKEYLQLISDIKKYAIFNNHSQLLGNAAGCISLENLVDWTIGRARIVGANQTIDELNKYVSSSEADISYVTLLAGVITDSEYTFCNGVKLKNAYNSIIGNILSKFSKYSDSQEIVTFPNIDTVLTQSFKQEIVHLDCTKNERPIWPADIEKVYEKEDDTVLCLSLARPIGYGIHPISSVFIAPDNLPVIRPVSGSSIKPYKQPGIEPSVIKPELRCANEILRSFSSLDVEFKTKLKISLSRLNSFNSGDNHIDRAINLRVCLESIFLYRNDRNIKQKMASRAAGFLGKDDDEKNEIFDLMKDAYSVTSNAVHNGKFSNNDNTRVLRESAKYARTALIKLIKEGSVDWRQHKFSPK